MPYASRVCALSTDITLLAAVERTAHELGLAYQSSIDCAGCTKPCASVIAVDTACDEYAGVVARAADKKRVLLGILPSTMSVATSKQHGIEVVVYRDLMPRFLPAVMKLAVLLSESEQKRSHASPSSGER